MNCNIKIRTLSYLLLGFFSYTTFASSPVPLISCSSKFDPKCATIVFQLGGFDASQGNAQNIGITDLIGDRFTVLQGHDQNVLLGLGYYVDGIKQDQVQLQYGLNAFYLAHTTVQGNVIQEDIFNNLSYSYNLTNYPIYLATKALINTNSDKYTVTLDIGFGPNFIKTSHYRESSLDGGITLPDQIFSGQTSMAFSATAAIGIKFNNVLGHVPLEVGYRFFYLGQGYLQKNNNQLTNTLNTGNNYANALVISISV